VISRSFSSNIVRKCGSTLKKGKRMARKYVEHGSENTSCGVLNVQDPSNITWEEWSEETFELLELPAEASWFLLSEFHRARYLKS
jgi:hypothetical protein